MTVHAAIHEPCAACPVRARELIERFLFEDLFAGSSIEHTRMLRTAAQTSREDRCLTALALASDELRVNGLDGASVSVPPESVRAAIGDVIAQRIAHHVGGGRRALAIRARPSLGGENEQANALPLGHFAPALLSLAGSRSPFR